MAKKVSKAKREMVWVYSPTANDAQKLAITRQFEPVIDELKKKIRPLPESQEFNHCIDVFGKWRGNHYSIMQKFKTGTHAVVDFFDTGLARLEYYGEGKFNLAYFRHTGQWVTIYQDITTDDAKKAILEDSWFDMF